MPRIRLFGWEPETGGDMRRFLVLLFVVLAVAACTPDPKAPPKALGPKVADLWRDFPVTSALDRPLIVLDPLPLTDEAAWGARRLPSRCPRRAAVEAAHRSGLLPVRHPHQRPGRPDRHPVPRVREPARGPGRGDRAHRVGLHHRPGRRGAARLGVPAGRRRHADLARPHDGLLRRLGSMVPSTLVTDLSVHRQTLSATFTVSWGCPVRGSRLRRSSRRRSSSRRSCRSG